MKKMWLMIVVVLQMMILSACIPGIASPRKEDDPNYVQTISEEYNVSIDYHDTDHYSELYFASIAENEDGKKVSHSDVYDVVYGFTPEDQSILLIIPESSLDPVVAIYDLDFPTKQDIETIVSIFNETTESSLLDTEEQIYSNDIVLQITWMPFMYIEHVNEPNVTYPGLPEWNLYKDWLTSPYIFKIGYYRTGYATDFDVIMGRNDEALLFIKSSEETAEILLELPFMDIDNYINNSSE